jgi:hypothetical protein
MKKIEVQMLLYMLTKHFMEVQRYMLNSFGGWKHAKVYQKNSLPKLKNINLW